MEVADSMQLVRKTCPAPSRSELQTGRGIVDDQNADEWPS